MNSFAIQAPPRIEFGWGSRGTLAGHAAALGWRPLVVTGRRLAASGELEPLLKSLRERGLSPRVHSGVPPEPELDAVDECVDALGDADVVIGIGGGSVLDVAKAAAALRPLSPAGSLPTAARYFEGEPVPQRGRPIIAMPTTSGTGSEVTWVCVLVDRQARRKASIRGPAMMPAVAIVDPELTVSCPACVTAASGADAFVQAVEAYTASTANPWTDALALRAAELAAKWLAEAVRSPTRREAREGMSLASLMAGMALNTSRLGLVHGLAHPLGAVTGAAHGVLCGVLLPPVIRFNGEAAGAKYRDLARALGLAGAGGGPSQAVESLIDFSRGLFESIGIPAGLRELGFGEEDVDWVAQEALPSGSTQANPRPVDLADARAVARAAM